MHERRIHVLGVLGCLDPSRAARFFETLTALTPAGNDQDHVHVLVMSGRNLSNPAPENHLHANSGRPLSILVRSAVAAHRAGATLLVIPGDAGHELAHEIEVAVGLEVIRWVDVTVGAAREYRGTTAILGPPDVIDSGVYQRAFDRTGGSYLAAPPDLLGRLVQASQWPPDAQCRVVLSACHEMADYGATSAVWAFDALLSGWRQAVPQSPIPLLDPATAVAEYVVRRAKAELIEL